MRDMTIRGPRVYLARHGETDWNAAGRWQGHTDVPLNDNGRAQAMALGAQLRGAGIASVGSSDLSRARETATIAGGAIGVAASFVDAGLRERRFGRFEGLTRDECVARFPVEWARYLADPRTAPPDGEPQEALLARATAAVILAASTLASPLLLVTHGGTMRALLSSMLGAPVAPIANGAVHVVRVEDGRLVDAAPLDPIR